MPYKHIAAKINAAVLMAKNEPLLFSDMALSLKRIWPTAMPKTHKKVATYVLVNYSSPII